MDKVFASVYWNYQGKDSKESVHLKHNIKISEQQQEGKKWYSNL